MRDLLLRNGTVFDGSGRPGFPGSILVRDGRIADLGHFDSPPDAAEEDCTGLAVAPGLIDAHSHSDLQVLEGRKEKTLQGVTTEVVGNCGFSVFPAPEDRAPLHEFANGILCGNDAWGWRSARDYLSDAERTADAVTVAALAGHGTLRIAHAGTRLGPLPDTTVAAMEHSLDDALADGAVGFSTGLMYSPGESAPFDELERLCRVVARRGKIYCTHMRDYGFKLLEAVDKQIELARHAGCRLQISHLQAVGPANWHLQEPALEKIERAQSEGVDIAFDCYPYVAGSTVLTQWLPQWALGGGISALLARLADRPTRARIAAETLAGMAHRWTDLVVSSVASAANRPLVGRTLQDVADLRNREPIEAAFDLLEEERGEVLILEFNQSEDNLRRTLSHPLSIVISDGFYVRGRPHPRLHGAFAQLLGNVCRDKNWMPLAEAIRKVTAFPAERFGIRDRGRLERGFHADIVVFDPATVGSPATYDNPAVPPTGIRLVLRNGCILHRT